VNPPLDIHAIAAGQHVDRVAASAIAAATKEHRRPLPNSVTNGICAAVRAMVHEVADDARQLDAALAEIEERRLQAEADES